MNRISNFIFITHLAYLIPQSVKVFLESVKLFLQLMKLFLQSNQPILQKMRYANQTILIILKRLKPMNWTK
jgi:hypothetical protein